MATRMSGWRPCKVISVDLAPFAQVLQTAFVWWLGGLGRWVMGGGVPVVRLLSALLWIAIRVGVR